MGREEVAPHAGAWIETACVYTLDLLGLSLPAGVVEALPMMIRMDTQEARRRFSEVLDRVHQSGDSVILERSGEPMAVVVPLELYERLVAERDVSFGVLDRIRARVPDLPEDEVSEDVAEAVRAVRNSLQGDS